MATHPLQYADKARRLDDQYAQHHHRFDYLIKLRRETGQQDPGIHALDNQCPDNREQQIKAPAHQRAAADNDRQNGIQL